MCDLDDLEPFDFLHEKECKARKDYRCDCCGGPILRGEKYLRHANKFDGKVSSERMCSSCKSERPY